MIFQPPMMSVKKIAAAALCLFSLLAGTGAMYARGWESLKSERVAESRLVIRDSDVEIRSVKGAIIIVSNRPVAVKVFTILGQLISQDTLPAGTSRLNISGHGVYIVKVADITCKVAL